MTWRIRHVHGDVAAFHGADAVADRSVTFVTVERPTLVLGSAQSPDAVDARVASALGVQVVRRRSGGGAVLLMPDEFVWADVVVPAGDPLWDVDVARSMVWVGDWWASALATSSTVHHGALVASHWSRHVCWAGVGAGEVLDPSGRKLVGISQRRTREVARFQTMCHLRVRPELVVALLAPPRPTASELAPMFGVVDRPAAAMVAALIGHLPST
jgi:lipoate-protein ligase A